MRRDRWRSLVWLANKVDTTACAMVNGMAAPSINSVSGMLGMITVSPMGGAILTLV